MAIDIAIAFFYCNYWFLLVPFQILSDALSVDMNDGFGWLAGIAPLGSRTSLAFANEGTTIE